MLPQRIEWVIVLFVLLIRVIIPLAIAAAIVVLLVHLVRRRKKGAPAAPTGSAPQRADAPSSEVAESVDRLFAEHNLTDRERDILIGVYRGKTQAQLAEEMCLSRSTIGTYCTRAYEKLGVATRDEALEVLRRAAGRR